MVCMSNSCAVDGGSGARRGEQRGAAVLRQGPAFACQCAVGCAACGYECADRQGGFTGDRGQTETDKVADNRTSKPRRERRSVILARLRHLCSLLSLWCTIALNYKRDSTSLVSFGHNRSIRRGGSEKGARVCGGASGGAECTIRDDDYHQSHLFLVKGTAGIGRVSGLGEKETRLYWPLELLGSFRMPSEPRC